MNSADPPIYNLLTLVAVIVTGWFWARWFRRDSRLFVVYLGALGGALLGAKLLYLLVDGWRAWGAEDRWWQWATGKTVLGALLGGYVGVEIAKRWVGYRAVTGDWFALVAPVGILIGRVGCWFHGCCVGRPWPSDWYTVADRTGVERWPAAPMEILFNVVMIGVAWTCSRTDRLKGQLFHVYLMAYGIFRFLHEFIRSEARLAGPFTGYHFAALLLFVFGLAAFLHRREQPDVQTVNRFA